ncbi:hypothetical protein BJ994_003051 [Arthrobacter pigmenti]|uniref:Uncharacterized protein n=1 Tax=Arthrobacter pigmenti TaxID=271432 RepID=A0A846RWK2_9MICC|nr:hypothetical protein [Arthrobacter pigmenti]NJC23975.1 hypothetical protein [Arthrobacter pigmenti]
MLRSSRGALAVLVTGGSLLLIGILIAVLSQPVFVGDFGFIAGQGGGVSVDGNGYITNTPGFPTRLLGGLLLGSGVALAAAVGGYVLGRRRRA